VHDVNIMSTNAFVEKPIYLLTAKLDSPDISVYFSYDGYWWHVEKHYPWQPDAPKAYEEQETEHHGSFIRILKTPSYGSIIALRIGPTHGNYIWERSEYYNDRNG
jgi:hypothetical protein